MEFHKSWTLLGVDAKLLLFLCELQEGKEEII